MSGEELRKGTFAKDYDVEILVNTEGTDTGEEKHPVGDGCNALIRDNRGMTSKRNEETGGGDEKTPVVVDSGDEREEEEE